MTRGLRTFAALLAVAWVVAGFVAPAAVGEASRDRVVAKPGRISSEVFARRDSLNDPNLSPDGEKMLSLYVVDGKEFLGVHTIATSDLKLFSKPDDGEIRWYRWAGNGRILVSIGRTTQWMGDEAMYTRLVAVDLATGKLTDIGRREEGLEGDDVLYVDPLGEWLLLSIQRTIYDWPSVFRVDLATNKMKQIVKPVDRIWEWYADTKGVVRYGLGSLNRKLIMVYRKSEDESFKRVGSARFDDLEESLRLLNIPSGSDEGFILSNEQTGRYGIYRYNFATGKVGELFFDVPTNDVSGASLSEDGKGVRSAWYTDDSDRIVWFDPVMKQHQNEIDAALKGRTNRMVSRSTDDKRMLVWTGSANDPGSYYYYVPETGTMVRFAKVNEKIDPRALVPTTYVKYKARDGLEIPAYLTVPAGRLRKDLPLIIMPHGGPYGIRDALEYNYEVQFLANRGYVVLQPNYRGSRSYGREFTKSGEGQWGRKMQDDLDDGMDWLASRGLIDPKRVCIVGWSYGGYAALWGATRNPERYRCAASGAGVSDLRRQLNYTNDFFASRAAAREWRERVRGDKAFNVDDVSPLRQVDRLKVPVLLVHGEDDQTVPFKQSSLYAAALAKAGKPHEFYAYPGEGHGFSSEKNNKDWLDKLEAFLAKHNPAD